MTFDMLRVGKRAGSVDKRFSHEMLSLSYQQHFPARLEAANVNRWKSDGQTSLKDDHQHFDGADVVEMNVV